MVRGSRDSTPLRSLTRAQDPVLRDIRQPRDLSRRLDGEHGAGCDPLRHGAPSGLSRRPGIVGCGWRRFRGRGRRGNSRRRTRLKVVLPKWSCRAHVNGPPAGLRWTSACPKNYLTAEGTPTTRSRQCTGSGAEVDAPGRAVLDLCRKEKPRWGGAEELGFTNASSLQASVAQLRLYPKFGIV